MSWGGIVDGLSPLVPLMSPGALPLNTRVGAHCSLARGQFRLSRKVRRPLPWCKKPHARNVAQSICDGRRFAISGKRDQRAPSTLPFRIIIRRTLRAMGAMDERDGQTRVLLDWSERIVNGNHFCLWRSDTTR